MTRAAEELPMIHLKAGELYCSDQPALVVTVLGSCASVTFYSRRLGIGGICHGMLPTCGKGASCAGDCAEKFTYVDCAIRQMAKFFDRCGVRRSEIEVKCFGGADMFAQAAEKPGLLSVGRQNCLIAEQTIKREGLTLVSRDLGGRQGRKIFFYTHTGEVLLKRLTGSGEVSVAAPQRLPLTGLSAPWTGEA